MRGWSALTVGLLLALAGGAAAPAASAAHGAAPGPGRPGREHLSHGIFRDVAVYRPPSGQVKGFVLFLSGDGGWDPPSAAFAEALARQGALVAGIDDRRLTRELERGGGCISPDGDLENLSHFIQAYHHVPTYLTPVLAGYSAGASLAYAVAAQSPKGLFSALLTLGFSAEIDLREPLCRSGMLRFRPGATHRSFNLLPNGRLPVPWINLTGTRDRVCPANLAHAFVTRVPGAEMVLLRNVDHSFAVPSRWQPELDAAYDKLTARAEALPPPPATLSDLPIIEVPAGGTAARAGKLFAVFLSGDGGWAGIDKEVADALAARGIPVAGIDSLRYFWTPRTPEGLASDLDRTLRYYATHWHRSRALLIGYSQGADVLPFAVNRLPPPTRELLATTVLIGVSRSASFEFHLSNWIGDGGGLPVMPEVTKLSAATTLCLYGEDDADSICGELGPAHARVVRLPGGHHFDGDYGRVARLIVEQARGAAAHAAAAHGTTFSTILPRTCPLSSTRCASATSSSG
jgi:type IV secretory pathway VirJ component